MYFKIIFNVIAISFLAVIQIGFISALPGWPAYANLAVVVLIYILGFWGLKYALVWGVGTAFILDIYSFSFFGLHSLGFLAALLLANFLLNSVFTNRSLYSFAAIAALAGLAYKLLLFLGVFFIDRLRGEAFANFFEYGFWRGAAIEIIMNIIIAVICFYILVYLGTSLKPALLNRKNL